MNQALSIHLPIKHSALVWLVIGWSFFSAQVSGQDFIRFGVRSLCRHG